MAEASATGWVPLKRVLAAIEALGFDSDGVYEVKISLHDVTVSRHQRIDGQPTGITITQVVPIDRTSADG